MPYYCLHVIPLNQSTKNPMKEFRTTWSDCYKKIVVRPERNAIYIDAPKDIGHDRLVGLHPDALMRYGIENDCIVWK